MKSRRLQGTEWTVAELWTCHLVRHKQQVSFKTRLGHETRHKANQCIAERENVFKDAGLYLSHSKAGYKIHNMKVLVTYTNREVMKLKSAIKLGNIRSYEPSYSAAPHPRVVPNYWAISAARKCTLVTSMAGLNHIRDRAVIRPSRSIIILGMFDSRSCTLPPSNAECWCVMKFPWVTVN
jgi:hypothetical protein